MQTKGPHVQCRPANHQIVKRIMREWHDQRRRGAQPLIPVLVQRHAARALGFVNNRQLAFELLNNQQRACKQVGNAGWQAGGKQGANKPRYRHVLHPQL
ncbi:hypothetical protein D3C73_1422910 [compost metagenome]